MGQRGYEAKDECIEQDAGRSLGPGWFKPRGVDLTTQRSKDFQKCRHLTTVSTSNKDRQSRHIAVQQPRADERGDWRYLEYHSTSAHRREFTQSHRQSTLYLCLFNFAQDDGQYPHTPLRSLRHSDHSFPISPPSPSITVILYLTFHSHPPGNRIITPPSWTDGRCTHRNRVRSRRIFPRPSSGSKDIPDQEPTCRQSTYHSRLIPRHASTPPPAHLHLVQALPCAHRRFLAWTVDAALPISFAASSARPTDQRNTDAESPSRLGANQSLQSPPLRTLGQLVWPTKSDSSATRLQ